MKAMVSKLTAAQRKEIHDECRKEFNKLTSMYNEQAALQVLHILHFCFDFTPDDLQRFADKLLEMQAEAVNRYEISDGEVPDICEIQLRNADVDVDKLLGR
jgi:galactokinase